MVSGALDIKVHSRLTKQGKVNKLSLTLPSIIGIFLLGMFVCMALANAWFGADVTKLAFEVEKLRQTGNLLKDDIARLDIEMGKLTSPERIREGIAPQLGMVLPKSKPIILEK